MTVKIYYEAYFYYFYSIIISAVTINRIQNKSFVYIIYACVLCIFIMYI